MRPLQIPACFGWRAWPPIIGLMAKRISSTDRAPSRSDVSQRPDGPQEPRNAYPRRARVVISILVIYHLMAVFVGAWNSAPPPSPLAEAVATPFRHYVMLLDLNHGYRFFAPDPGPSHLFHYTLTLSDGTTRRGHFPDREEHWPRLLYHRYFMLSEQASGFLPGRPPPGESETAPAEAYSRFDSLANSYSAHLLKTSDATRIHWRLVRHMIPLAEEVAAGRSLTDERLYETLRSGALLREQPAGEVR